MVRYLDSSAILKLVFDEPESAALRDWQLSSPARLVASELARAETVRAARRAVSAAEDLARAALTAVTLVPITASIIETAATLDPPLLRTLDAIHLATALLIQDELEAVVTYDERLADAARAHGLAVAAPF